MAPFEKDSSRYNSHFADTGGFKTHYIEAGSGQPVILIHGGGPGADGYGNWEGCIERFAAKTRPIVYDMVGFGKSDAPSPDSFEYSQDARTTQLINLIEALNLNNVVVVGNSMGGITSLDATIRRPDLISKLVLMGSAGIHMDHGMPAALAPLINYDFTEDGMIAVIRTLTNPEFKADPALVSYRVELSRKAELQAAFGATMGWVRGQGGLHLADDAISSVKVPTLVVGGKNDPIVTMKEQFRFLELIENSWGYLMPNTGHWVMVERPDEFSKAVLDFIEA